MTPQILAMYLGCEISTPEQDAILTGLTTKSTGGDSNLCRVQCFYKQRDVIRFFDMSECLPILRKLEDMTEEEAEQCAILTGKSKIYSGRYWQHNKSFMNITQYQAFNVTAYLLSKSFDLFGLIEAGEAIDQKLI